VDDLDRAPAIGKEIEQAAGKGYMTNNWIEQNRELFTALKEEQVVTFIVITLIVIVAALNILIALTMMVMEKTRDIAVMMSFGVEPGQVRRIFLLQGFLISLIGTRDWGWCLATLASWAGGHYHFIHLSAEVYSIDTLPFRAARTRRGDCGRGVDRDFAAGYAVSVFGGGASAAGRGAAVRIVARGSMNSSSNQLPRRWSSGADHGKARSCASTTATAE
jgi:hypothetical protein